MNVGEKHTSEAIHSGAPVNVEALVEGLSKLLLPELRQVFEASFTSHLAGLKQSNPGNGDYCKDPLKEDARATEALNALSSTLTVNDDDE